MTVQPVYPLLEKLVVANLKPRGVIPTPENIEYCSRMLIVNGYPNAKQPVIQETITLYVDAVRRLQQEIRQSGGRENFIAEVYD
jgi:hypothetical protein